jgi:hypothetical protein
MVTENGAWQGQQILVRCEKLHEGASLVGGMQ